jgi:hypothetical protein
VVWNLKLYNIQNKVTRSWNCGLGLIYSFKIDSVDGVRIGRGVEKV